MRRAVFLDRDGTLIEEYGYLARLDHLSIYAYSVDAVRLLNRAGYAVVVVTNQSGVARGLVEETFVSTVHRHLSERFEAGGARIDGFYYCPHHPEAPLEAYRIRCECRKPQPGMLRSAAADLTLDLPRSFIVGDRWQDVQAGAAVGARGVLVRTGYGRIDEPARPERLEAEITDNLMGAVSWILRQP